MAMQKFIDDDLNDVTLATANPKAQTATAVVATKPVAAKATAVVEDDGVDLLNDYESLKAQTSLQSVLPKESSKYVRFFLVPGYKAFVANTHFLATVGKGATVVCPGEGCVECEKGGSEHSSRRKIVALAGKYETGNDCKLAAGVKPNITIGFINMSPSAYTTMSECPSEGETVFTIDFKTVKKNTNIGWDFFRQSSPAAYTKVEGLAEEVAALAAEAYGDGKAVKSRLGRKVTAQELKSMLRVGSSSAEEATLDNIEDL